MRKSVSLAASEAVRYWWPSLSEAEVHWRDFLSSLKTRGMQGMKLVISDAHEGLKAALKAVMPSVPWQRCQFHLMQNAMQYIPKIEMRKQVAQDLRSVFNARDIDDANEELKRFVELYKDTAPNVASWAEENIPEGLAVFLIPKDHRKRMPTTNMLDRQSKEIKRRTRVAKMIPKDLARFGRRNLSERLIKITVHGGLPVGYSRRQS